MNLETFNLLYAMDVCSHLIPEDRRQYAAFTGNRYDIDEMIVHVCQLPGPKWAARGLAAPFALAIGGYMPVRKGVYHSWMLTRPEAWFRGSPITSLTAEVVTGMLKNGAHRLETVCLADRLDARAWYPKIGLQYETTLKNYGVGGEDAVSYIALAEVPK